MDDCLRINKPCKFEGLASEWPASKKWQFGENGYDYLLDKFSNQNVAVYLTKQEEYDMRLSLTYVNSFNNKNVMQMPYKEFLKQMSGNQLEVNLKEGDYKTFEKLSGDL